MHCLLKILLIVLLLPHLARSEASLTGDGALIRTLDTMTGRVVDLEIELGVTIEFAKFEITLEDCRYLAENPAKYSYAFVTIMDQGDHSELFSAWLISQSPALSAVEHPRFDFWLIRCTTLSPDASMGTEVN